MDAPSRTDDAPYQVGDSVKIKYGSRGKWYAGSVLEVRCRLVFLEAVKKKKRVSTFCARSLSHFFALSLSSLSFTLLRSIPRR